MADFEAIVKKHIGEDGSIPATAIGTLVTDIKTTVGNEFVGKERYKAKLSEIDSMKNKLQDAEDNVQTAEGWKDKYNALKSEFDGYKVAETKKAEQAKKAEAYKALLKKAGVSDKRIDTVAKVASLDSITLDEGGNIVDADKLEVALRKLKNDRFAVFVVGDVRDKQGLYRDFISDTKKIFIEIKPYEQTQKPDPIFEGAKLKEMKAYNRKAETYLVNMAKWDAAKKYFNARGCDFAVFTERTLAKLGILID